MSDKTLEYFDSTVLLYLYLFYAYGIISIQEFRIKWLWCRGKHAETSSGGQNSAYFFDKGKSNLET